MNIRSTIQCALAAAAVLLIASAAAAAPVTAKETAAKMKSAPAKVIAKSKHAPPAATQKHAPAVVNKAKAAHRTAQRATTTRAREAREPMKHELAQHAQRAAYLDRAEATARERHDTVGAGRVAKLTERENARHEAWMKAYSNRASAKTSAKK